MEVKKYEIDMLDVKVADAFLIHFFDENNAEYVVLIDGGNYSDGTKIASFIREHYSQNYINLAICTHCDDDHFGGIHYLLEQQKSGGLAGTRRPIGAPDGTQTVAIHGGRESLRTGVETKGARSSQTVPA